MQQQPGAGAPLLPGRYQHRGQRRRNERRRLDVVEAHDRQILGYAQATGPGDDPDFGISEFEIADKHGLLHRAYNAKINIHRRNGEPIYLGLREEDLDDFQARLVSATAAS